MAVALSSLTAGAAAGAAVIGSGMFLFRLTAPPSSVHDPSHFLLQGSVMLAIGLAAGLAWWSARTLPDGWRRGVTAAIGAFGGLLLGALTVPADMLAGRAGLLVFAIAMTAIAWRAVRAARRAAQT